MKEEILSIASDLREGSMTTDEAIQQLKQLIDCQSNIQKLDDLILTTKKILKEINKEAHKPIEINCSTCKHINVSKYIDPCHSCNGYSNHILNYKI